VSTGVLADTFEELRSRVLTKIAKLSGLEGIEAERAVEQFERHVAREARPRRREMDTMVPSDLHDYGHVVTQWKNSPDATDQFGDYIALPARGDLSVESMLKKVNPRLQLEDALPFLLKNGTLKPIGAFYIPNRAFVLHDKETLPDHQMLVLSQLLDNFIHQQSLKAGETSWPQRVAECPDFPVSELEPYITKLRERVREFLESESDRMARLAHEAPPNAARVRTALNMFFQASGSAGAEGVPERKGDRHL
jgi:hypothetical protein